MAKRVTESIINMTSAPWSRKCSAIVGGRQGGLDAHQRGWSDVATTTIERAIAGPEVAVDELLDLAATLADEADDVDVGRGRASDHPEQGRLADARASEDAQALAAAAGDERVERAHAERHAVGDPRAPQGRRRRADNRALGQRVQRRTTVDRVAKAIKNATEQLSADRDRDLTAGRGDDVAGPDALHLTERHQQRAA